MCRPIRLDETEYAHNRTGNVLTRKLAINGTTTDQRLGFYFQYDGLNRLRRNV